MRCDHFDLPRYLSMLPLFAGMDAAGLRRTAAACSLRRLGRGAPVFRAGDACTELNVTVTGQVKVFALSAAGQEKVIELAGPGTSFAEASVFTGGTYRVNADALTDTLLLSVAKAALLAEIAGDAGLALRMLVDVSQRLQGLTHDVATQSLHSGLQRVIDFLTQDLDEARRAAVTVTLPVSKATIASRLSLTPEYFSRVLRELQSAGLLRVDRRAIRIPDPRRLQAYAQAA